MIRMGQAKHTCRRSVKLIKARQVKCSWTGNPPVHLGRGAVLPSQIQIFGRICLSGGKKTGCVSRTKARWCQQLIEPSVRIHPGQLGMTVGHLGEIIDGGLAIYLNNLISRHKPSFLNGNSVNIGHAIGSFGDRDDGIVMLKGKGDIAQRAKGHVPIPIAAEKIEEIFVEGIFVLVFTRFDIALNIIESFIQINRGELELGCGRLREISLCRIKLKIQSQLLEGVFSVISLEWNVRETFVGGLSVNISPTRGCNSQNSLIGEGGGEECGGGGNEYRMHRTTPSRLYHSHHWSDCPGIAGKPISKTKKRQEPRQDRTVGFSS